MKSDSLSTKRSPSPEAWEMRSLVWMSEKLRRDKSVQRGTSGERERMQNVCVPSNEKLTIHKPTSDWI